MLYLASFVAGLMVGFSLYCWKVTKHRKKIETLEFELKIQKSILQQRLYNR